MARLMEIRTDRAHLITRACHSEVISRGIAVFAAITLELEVHEGINRTHLPGANPNTVPTLADSRLQRQLTNLLEDLLEDLP